MAEVEAIRRLLLRRTADTVEKIKRWKAEGNQAAIDEHLKFAHAPQEVAPEESGPGWTPYWHEGEFQWPQVAWLRDNSAGKFCLFWAQSGYGGCELRFERPEDAFAFKMRWG